MGLLASYILNNQQRNFQLEDQAARAAGTQKLFGSPGQEVQGPPLPMANGVLPEVVTYGGEGLLGGNGMFDPVNQAQFATGLMGLPGMEGYGAQNLNQVFNRGATRDWNEYQLESNQAFDLNAANTLAEANLNEFTQGEQGLDRRALGRNAQSGANTRATIAGAEARNIYSEGEAFRRTQYDAAQDALDAPGDETYRGFKNKSEYLQRANALYDDARTANAGRRQALELVNRVTDTVTRGGGIQNMTGADDMNLIRALIKANNPGEAIMEGDITAARVAAGGYPGYFGSLAEQLKGDGSLTTGQRQELIESLMGTGQSLTGNMQETRADFAERATRADILPEDVLQQEMIFNRIDEALLGEKKLGGEEEKAIKARLWGGG